MREILRVKAGQLRHTKGHIRQSLGSEKDLRQLGRGFLSRPVNPIITTTDWEVVDGNRRLAGVLLERGPEAEILVCRTDEMVDERAKLEIMLQSAIHTRGLSDYEQFLGFTKWQEGNPDATGEALSKRMQFSASTVSRILSLRRAVEPIKEAAAAGLINSAEWSEYAKCDPKTQHEMWESRIAGRLRTKNDIVRAGRKARAGNEPSVRASRITIPLLSGTRIVLTGKRLSLAEVIECLSSAIDAAKRGMKDNLDARTWQNVMRDKAKKASENS